MAYLRATRPLNALIAGLVAVVGAYLAGPGSWVLAGLAFFSAALLIAWANLDNDIQDQDADRVSHPERPLAQGELSPSGARLFSWALLIAAMALAVPLPPLAIFVFLSVLALTALYNRYLKKLPLVSAVAVSTAGGLGFLFGGALGRDMGGPAWAGLLAFFFHMARESVKSLEDMEGDRVAGRRTLPLIWGQRAGLWAATILGLALILATPWPYLTGVLGPGYMIAVAVLVDGVWVGLLVMLWTTRNYGLVSTIAKIDMLAALVALVLGKI